MLSEVSNRAQLHISTLSLRSPKKKNLWDVFPGKSHTKVFSGFTSRCIMRCLERRLWICESGLPRFGMGSLALQQSPLCFLPGLDRYRRHILKPQAPVDETKQRPAILQRSAQKLNHCPRPSRSRSGAWVYNKKSSVCRGCTVLLSCLALELLHNHTLQHRQQFTAIVKATTGYICAPYYVRELAMIRESNFQIGSEELLQLRMQSHW